jgi:predicted RNA-binding protein
LGDLDIQEDNIKMDPKEIRCEDEVWIHVAQNRVQLWALLNSYKLLDSINSEKFLDYLNDY